MTERLYYNDPYLREFDASIRRVSERGDRFVVTLDRTAFYPTSGGQPFDLGTLGPLRVVDVVDEDDGTIAHVVDVTPAASGGQTPGSDPGSDPRAPRLTRGDSVHGVIDWARRFDHMQQHTGQHLLSAAFDKLFTVRTVSFHLGAAVSTIDLAREMTALEIAAAETEANRIVWENRPVSIRYETADDAAKLPLRKQPARGGTLRLIDVDAFDLSACGGTHVSRTGAIGVIAVGAWERFKGGQRIEFICGGRALGRFRAVRDIVGTGVRLLSVLPEELPASIERLQAEAKEQKRAIAVLQSELARSRAQDLAASAEVVRLADTTEGSARLVLQAVDGDALALKTLATAITARPGHLVVLASTAKPALVVVARSADVAAAANQILTSLTATFGGRGGGKPELAQAGGLEATPAAILAAARQMIVGGHWQA